MSKRITLTEMLQNKQNELEQLQANYNAIVQQANQRITETVQDAEAKISDLNNKIDSLVESHNKELASQKSSTKYYSDRVDTMVRDNKNLQDILDVVPGVVTRYKNPEDKYSEEVPLIVRFASILAAGFNK